MAALEPDITLSSRRSLMRSYARPHAVWITVAFLLTMALGIVSAIVPALIGPCLQVLMAPLDMPLSWSSLLGERLAPLATRLTGAAAFSAASLLSALPLALLVLAFMKSLIGLSQWGLWEIISEKMAHSIRSDLAARYLAVSPARRHEDGHVEGELASAVGFDVRTLREYVVHYYGGLPREAAQSFFLALTLVALSPRLFLVFVFGVAPAAAIASRIGRKIRKRTSRALADSSVLSEWIQQRLLGIETIKHYATEALEARKMRELTSKLTAVFMRVARVKARTAPALEVFAIVALVAVLWFALRDIAHGVISGATLMSFFSTLAMLSQTAGKLGRYLNSNREGAAAAERLERAFAFLDERRLAKVTLPIANAPAGGQALILCEQLSAHYPGRSEPVLEDFDYRFEAGQVYCIAGPSGAGKSTLLKMLLGLVVPSTGSVRFLAPNADLAEVGYLPQKVQLMPGTIGENIAYPAGDLDAERARAALARVGLDELVSRFALGLDSLVGEGGTGLSGGQAQRVLLARLCYRRPRFVLVDEGTSALDPEVERLAYELFREMARDGAVVVGIAHRPSAALAADRLLILEQGKLLVEGNPGEILAQRDASLFFEP